jgi:aryl-alcohol dehydrogenase-like predicted oxidoreductase
MTDSRLTRRAVLGAGATLLLTGARAAAQPARRMQTRSIPSTGEALPVIGLGTYRGFDAAPGSADYRALPGVLDALFAAGGTVIDSSPMYGRAERTTGELLALRTPRPPAFLATKVWTSGRDAGSRQIEA